LFSTFGREISGHRCACRRRTRITSNRRHRWRSTAWWRWSNSAGGQTGCPQNFYSFHRTFAGDLSSEISSVLAFM